MVDASGTIFGFGTKGDVAFANGKEMATQLAQSPDVARCVGGTMAAYTFGMTEGKVLAAPAQSTALVEGKTSLYEFFAQLAASSPDLLRYCGLTLARFGP